MKALVVVLTILLPYCLASNGINNFHFIGSNVVYGTKIPQTIHVRGSYYISLEDPHITNLKNYAFFNNSIVGKTHFWVGMLNSGPWVCTKNVKDIIANINKDNHDSFDIYIFYFVFYIRLKVLI